MKLAGEGPLSDGVPRHIQSASKIPPPPRQSRKLEDEQFAWVGDDVTVRIRRKP